MPRCKSAEAGEKLNLHADGVVREITGGNDGLTSRHSANGVSRPHLQRLACHSQLEFLLLQECPQFARHGRIRAVLTDRRARSQKQL
jgi:hypothetical protein